MAASLKEYDFSLCKLKDPSRNVRIIEILPSLGSSNDRIEVRLHQIQPRENKEVYNALSWCWRAYKDDAGAEAIIHIHHNELKYEFKVSKNLADALKMLRAKPGRVRRVWVDWICIDQKNVEERNNQVQLMSTIYGAADQVFIWLGQHSHDSEIAFQFIPNLLEIDRFPSLVRDPNNHNKWKALKELMMRDWFSRRWIIQEIALASRARILCGTNDLDWKDFADAISLFNLYETETHAISEIMMGQSDYVYQPDYFGSIPALGAARLVEVTDNLFEPGGGKSPNRVRQQSLEYLVSTFTPFNASEARDTIYAILAIARDSTPRTDSQWTSVSQEKSLQDKPNSLMETDSSKLKTVTVEEISRASKDFGIHLRTFAAIVDKHSRSKPYHVDYSLPISDVYVEFVRFSIARAAALDPTRALDILCRSWAPDPDFPKIAAGRGNANHGHWRVAFQGRKGFDGKMAIDQWTRKEILQSPRDEVQTFNEYDVVGWPDVYDGPVRLRHQESGKTRLVKTEDTLPSWTPSTDRSPYAWNKKAGDDRKMTRKNADLLVGDPSQRIYSASGKRGVTRALHFEDGVIEDQSMSNIHHTHYHSIYTEGFVLGKVEELSDRSQGGQIPFRWADLIYDHELPEDTSQQGFWNRPAAEDFWRTLVGDRGISASNPPRCIGRILSCHYTGEIDLDLKQTIFYSKHQPAASFSRHIHAIIWNRRLMRVSKTKSYRAKSKDAPTAIEYDGSNIGLAPDDAQPEDLVCILYGCSVPVILRKYVKSPSVVESQWRQQKLKAARRIATWWHGYLLGKKLLVLAEWEARQQAKTAQPTTEFTLPATPKRTRSGATATRAGKKRTSFAETDHNTETSFSLRKRAKHDSVSDHHIIPQPDQSPRQATSPQMYRTTSNSAKAREEGPERDHDVFYRLIGECYVHRMMRGEAIDHQTEKKLPPVIFEIR